MGSPMNYIIRRKTLLIASTTLLVVVLVVVLASTIINKCHQSDTSPLHSLSFHLSDSSDALSPSRLCRRAIDPDACQTVLNQIVSRTGGTKIRRLTSLLRKVLTEHIRDMSVAKLKFNVVGSKYVHPREIRAIADCVELVDLSIGEVKNTIDAVLASHSQSSRRARRADALTSLSAVLTNHITCLDGLNASEKSQIKGVLEDLISRARIALAVFAEITGQNEDEMRKGLSHKGAFPPWVKARDRKLLQSKGQDIKPDIVVSQDGSGNFTTLNEAVDAVKRLPVTMTRVVIYVKKGVYNEYVEFDCANVIIDCVSKNVMIVGDGMTETIITGDHNYVDGYTTYNSFTVASKAPNLILQDLCIQNTAGPDKHQAVALRVGGDRTIVNRCQIEGYQDTLYAHSKRQFYRGCNLTGTVDFIFGNAAAVFQNCHIVSRKPMDDQQNMVTAQGRIDPNQNTGISLQFCNIIPTDNLRLVSQTIPTYLGRPWKNFSRTMVMQSFIDGHIDPAGWHEWSGDAFLDTCWFGEFLNNGPGSSTAKRVQWPGYHPVGLPLVARTFTVANLLESNLLDRWVAHSGVAYTEGLVPVHLIHENINHSNNNVN